MSADAPIHATLIAARQGGAWRGVLLRGRSGVGKSDLAIRAVAAGWALVADDRVRLWSSAGALYGCAPSRLAGLVEARGIGVLRAAVLPFARIALVAEGVARDIELDRAPAADAVTLCGHPTPRIRVSFLDAGTVARLALTLDAALARRDPL